MGYKEITIDEILRSAVKREAIIQIQYADFGLDSWTAPSRMTEDKMDRVINDGSVRKVRVEFEM